MFRPLYSGEEPHHILTLSQKGKVFLFHAMQAYRRIKVMASLVLKLDTTWM
jgi:hypothetical protein